MTLLLLLEATNGLLAIADGRTTRHEPCGEPFPASDTARKVACVPGATVVAMAAGRMNFTAHDVATIFETALKDAVAAADKSGAALSVERAARACFEALSHANDEHDIPGHGVTAVVAGFDSADRAPRVYEFTVPDTTDGPQPCADFAKDRFLARPHCNDTSDEVRAEFGLLTTGQWLERLDRCEDDPTTDLSGSYSLATYDLDRLVPLVSERVYQFLASDTDRLDREGIGGYWRIHLVRADREVEQTTAPWGPMRVGKR